MEETTVGETTVEETTVGETTVEETTVGETTVEETTVEETTVEETTAEATTVAETTVVETRVEETTSLFDENKELVLEDFMNQWGAVMEQSYEQFTPGQEGNMYGVVFPTDVIESLAVNNQLVPAYWSEDGNSIESGDYAIVAAYHNYNDFSQQNPNEPAGANYYLFAIVNEQPVVLVSQQNQGQADGLIHFQPTENTALQVGFEQIVATGSFDLALLQ